MAADLTGYRTAEFEEWLRNLAESWEAEDGRTLIETFRTRANNWGSMAFGSLCAIYRYLGDRERLAGVRSYWVDAVNGYARDLKYGDDMTWHIDASRPRLINPPGSSIGGAGVSGIIPDDMRRGGSFKSPPGYTQYPWEHLQGTVTAARILERAGMPIWDEGDQAIYRAVHQLETVYAEAFGDEWKAVGDDAWMLPFIDAAYGSDFSRDTAEPGRLWKHGKIAGWGIVTLAEQSNSGVWSDSTAGTDDFTGTGDAADSNADVTNADSCLNKHGRRKRSRHCR
jgi:hypothetical protein